MAELEGELPEDIIKAIERGDLECVKNWEIPDSSYLDTLKDTNDVERQYLKVKVSTKDMTALNYAATFCQFEILDFLLSKGADPTIPDKYNSNAIQSVVSSKCGEDTKVAKMVERLLQRDVIERLELKNKNPKKDYINAVTTGKWTPALTAILLNRPETFRVLLENGANPAIDLKSNNIRLPLVLAACNSGDIMKMLLQDESVKTLIDEKCGPYQYTALHYAALHTRKENVKQLVENGADVEVQDKYRNYPIQYIVEANDVESFREMLKHLKGEANECINKKGHLGDTVLHIAAKLNKTDFIEVLVDNGADVEVKNDEGRYPVHYVCQHRGNEKVVHLVANRYVIVVRDREGYTPLIIAVMVNDFRLVQVLLRAEARILNPLKKDQKSPDRGRRAIHVATLVKGSDEDFKNMLNSFRLNMELVRFNKLLNYRDDDEKTPLHLAVQEGRSSRVEILLQHDADFSLKDRDGRSFIQFITLTEGNDENFRKMIQSFEKFIRLQPQKEDDFAEFLNEPGEGRRTALHTALDRGMYSRVEILLEFGADPRKSTTDLKNLVHLAAEKKMTDEEFESIITKLDVKNREFQQCIDAEDGRKKTPLHLVIERKWFSRMKILLKYQANPSIQDDEGKNCLHTAFSVESDGEVVKELVDAPCFSGTPSDMVTRQDEKECLPIHLLTENTPLSAVKALPDGACQWRDPHKDPKKNPLKQAIRLNKLDIVKVLLAKGAELDEETLREAVLERNENLARILIRHSGHLLSILECEELDNRSTPIFNQLVENMPDVAMEALDRCMAIKQSEEVVKFRYSFIDKEYAESRVTNPLQLMVDNESTELLQHPVIRSYLYIQWNHLGFWLFALYLILYGCFLTFLSLFSLTVNHPLTETCTNSTGADCGPFSRLAVTYILQGLVIFFGVILLLNEVARLTHYYLKVTHRWDYFKKFQTWNELLLIPLSMTFVFTFPNHCGCPTELQWQVGIFAIFLAWMNLLFIAATFPRTGTYIIIFKDILVTFLKLTSFSLILVVGFALILLMMFSNPEAEISSFSHIGHSFVRTVTMVTGELDFDELFHFGVPPSAYTPIPFHITNFIMWIIFLVLIPIVLGNMLTSLAVGDTTEVIAKAGLQKLTLQVNTVLRARVGRFPWKEWLLDDVYTNKKEKERHFGFKEFASYPPKLQLFIWGGEEFVSEVKTNDYERQREKEQEHLRCQSPVQTDLQKQLDQLLEIVEANKNSIRKMQK